MKNKAIDQLINDFVVNLSEATRQEAFAMMREALDGGVKKAGPLPKVARLVRRPTAGIKRSPEAIENQATKILGVLKKAKDGMRSEQIQDQLGTTAEQMQLPIKLLQRDGKITHKGVARGRQYFAK